MMIEKENGNQFKWFVVLLICNVLMVYSSQAQRIQYPAKPQALNQQQWQGLQQEFLDLQINASDGYDLGEPISQFGSSISVRGNIALIGANAANDNGAGSGEVYVFELQNGQWSYQSKLKPQDGKPGDRFGSSIAIDGSTTRAVIGSPQSGNSGAVYIYEKICSNECQWQEIEKLEAPILAADSRFGAAVGIDHDRIAVGATGGNGNVFIYNYDTVGAFWDFTHTLFSGISNDFFGAALSLIDDRIAISAWGDDTNGVNSGSVYLYDFIQNNWVQTEKIIAPDGSQDSVLFGIDVDLDNTGSQMVIGAPGDNTNTGAAYVFELDSNGTIGWNKLITSDASPNDNRGGKVAIDQNRVGFRDRRVW